MTLLSVNVGKPKPLDVGNRTTPSAIDKNPVLGPVMLSKKGLAGDGVGSPGVHGTPDQAAYAYSFAHYAYWANELGREDFTHGQFGENFTLHGMLEEDVCVGDLYRVGEALVQITKPRGPCFKLAAWLGQDQKTFVARFLATRRIGFYLRVIEEGFVCAGDAFGKTDADPVRLSVGETIRLMHEDPADPGGMKRALENGALSDDVRKHLNRRLEKIRA
ncbi:MAG: MOSC domain-containing protein [Rhodospirillales bacterium]